MGIRIYITDLENLKQFTIMSVTTEMLISPSRYRYKTVSQYQQRLQELVELYTTKKKKYHRRISIIDVTVYSVSGVIASAGIILSSVTMTAPIVIPIIISAVTAITGIFTGATKKISSCSASKFRDYTLKLSTATSVYSELTKLISSAITDQEISEEEFSNITNIYNTAIKKLNTDNNDIYHRNESIKSSKKIQRNSNNVE